MNRDWGLGPRAWGFVSGARSGAPGPEAPIPKPQAQGPSPFLAVRDIEKSFPQAEGRLFVLRRISLDVAAGDFVTIMGPSGAGKSTLLAVLGMLDSDWTGEYRLLEHDVHSLKHKDRAALGKRYVGFVFQQYHLIDDLTVAENLAMPLSYRDVKPDDREAAVADTLDRFGMVAKKNLYPRQLSGGQQQLVAVARAVIHRPSLLLADEPTGNLHSSQGKDIMQLFRELNAAGTTIVQVTHSEDNAKYGKRVIQLRDGWIVD
jgi:putative ABC transport system ATP-binding protein